MSPADLAAGAASTQCFTSLSQTAICDLETNTRVVLLVLGLISLLKPEPVSSKPLPAFWVGQEPRHPPLCTVATVQCLFVFLSFIRAGMWPSSEDSTRNDLILYPSAWVGILALLFAEASCWCAPWGVAGGGSSSWVPDTHTGGSD